MQPNFTLKHFGNFFRLTPVLLFFCCLSAGKTNAQCTWSASTAFPVTVLDQAVTSVGPNLYTFAGVSSAIFANSYKFDGNIWTAIAPTPQGLEFASAVTDGTNIFIMGGASTAGTPLTTNYRYNVATNTYTTLASFTTGTWNHAAVYLNGKIYKFAGTGPGTASTNVLEIYDIATNTWTTGAPYPLSISFVSAYAQGNFLYAAGGIESVGSLASSKTYRYDPATNSWNDAAISDLPATRWGAASGFYNNGFILAGGYVGGSLTANISTSVISWELASNSWTTLPNMLGERSRMNGGVLGNNFYVIGGRSVASAAFVGTVENQRLNCIPLTPCTGTPAVGNTVSSANPVCPNVSFTLATQTPPASGYTFQWQSSSTGVPASFTNITGATGSTFTTSQTVATYYRAIVTCGANTATSAPLQVTMNGFNSCYCTPIYTNACALGDYIANVKLGTLNNPSVCTGQFTYYSAVPAPDIFLGVTNTLTVSVGPDTFGQFVGAWIDFNQDGIFAPSEFLATPVNAGASGTVNYTFTVPPTATLGTTRMRIRGGDDVAMTSAMACGASNSTFGEAEDYNVNITPCVQGVFTTQPANTSVQCSANTTFSVATTGSALTFGWEYRINASSPWLNVPNAAPYSGLTTNTLTITNASSTLNGYQYRAYMQGPCTAVDFSTPATLTVTPLVAAVNPASATICLGSLQQLTLTNASSPTTTTFSSGPLSVQIPDLNGPPASTAAVCNAGINHTIPVSLPAGSIITRIDVRLNITHTYIGDLTIVLKGPNGQILNLDYHKSGTGTAGANFTNTVFSSTGTNPVSGGTAPGYTGLWRPDAATGAGSLGDLTGTGPTGFAPTVTTFNGIWTVPSGNWTIAMCDPQEWAGDIGTLTSWSMDITYGAPAAAGVWTASPATPNTMFTNAAGTTAYVAGSLANTIWVNPTVNTNYSVVYSTATPCTSAPTVVPVTVVTPVSAVVNPVNRAACVGGGATFTVSAAGGPLTYQWQVSSDAGLTWTNISGATAATLTLPPVTSSMNNYRYRAVISALPCAGAGGSVTTTAATLTVNSLPTVIISAPDVSLTPNQTTTITATSSPAAATWSWTLNGAAISGVANTQLVTINGLGVYQARATDVNGCVNTSNNLTIGPEASDRLWIYPNPNDGVFQVRLYYGGPITERRTVSIFKSNGQLVMEKEFTLDNVTSPYLRMDFDLSRFAGGTYVVKVHNRNTGIIVSGLVVIQ